MGSGEYGGNGSVHFYAMHRKDRNHGHGKPQNYHEVDEEPNSDGYFLVQVFNVLPDDIRILGRTLIARVAIKHDPLNYTPHVLVTWPPDAPPDWPPRDSQPLRSD